MAIEQVRSLVADRHKFEGWLEALDARRSETPERVYGRVREDYASRRAEVLDQLQALLPEMLALRDAREQHLRDLEAQLSQLEDERAEAMLRTAVGEFDTERWDAVRIEVEGKLLAVGEERDALLIEVDEIRTLIGQSQDEPATPDAPEPVVAADSGVLLDESRGETAAAATDTAESAQVESSYSAEQDVPMILDQIDDGDDVRMPHPADAVEVAVAVEAVEEPIGGIPGDAWLDSAADISDEVGTPVAPPAAADTVNIEAAIESVLLDSEAPVLPSAQPTTTDPDEWDEALGVFDGKPAVGGPAVPPRAPTPARGSGAVADPFDDMAFLRSIMDPAETPVPSLVTPMGGVPAIPDGLDGSTTGATAEKSLRCAECGTMNAATEWYCERCGGELITI